MMKFTAAFFADMSPRYLSSGWNCPPSAICSSPVSGILRGVSHTAKQSSNTTLMCLT